MEASPEVSQTRIEQLILHCQAFELYPLVISTHCQVHFLLNNVDQILQELYNMERACWIAVRAYSKNCILPHITPPDELWSCDACTVASKLATST